MHNYRLFIERKKKALKCLVLGPGVRITFRLSTHTPGYSLKSYPGQLPKKQPVKQNEK